MTLNGAESGQDSQNSGKTQDTQGSDAATNQKPATPKGSIDEFLESGIFPKDWALIPVRGKHPTDKSWHSKKLTQSEATTKFKAYRKFDGVGVVTGEFSGGLIALDIDGDDADARYQRVAGEAYRARGAEGTMSWTSGKPGRRNILWRVPEAMVSTLRNVTTLVCLDDGTWEACAYGAPRRDAEGNVIEDDRTKSKRPAQELVLRFNRCQSVLPGSVHPDTNKRYRFLNYNEGKVADAPKWIVDILWKFAKPVAWLAQDDIRAIKSEVGHTLIPPKQLRGWMYNNEEVRRKLLPRLEELVFKHPVFDKYGWVTREGSVPQRLSGCPWHESSSGTSFQYNPENGVWCCHACGVGGDELDFIHKIETGDMHAERPIGAELERYIQPIAEALGYKYPDDLQMVQKTTNVPQLQLSPSEFFKELRKIERRTPNPEAAYARMADLATQCGKRLTGQQCYEALQNYSYYENAERLNANNNWWDVEPMKFLIPNLLARPSQVMLHSAPGLGKTSTAMGLAAAVLYGKTMLIRGIKHKIPKGKVLWIQNDQSRAKFKRDCEDNNIVYDEVKDNLIVKTGFQFNHLHNLRKWIIEHRPLLVVVDSIGSASTHISVQEKDKAFATPFYKIGEMNGSYSPKYDKELAQIKKNLKAKHPDGWNDDMPNEAYLKELDAWLDANEYRISGFPATSFVWVHHDNANGEARGTRYLPAAMDEQWHLRRITDEERTELLGKGLEPGNCRFITIKKSRSGREGDRLLVQRNLTGAFSLTDFTPCEKRSDNGLGDPEPSTMALKLVRDAVEALRAGESEPEALRCLKAPSGGLDEQGLTAAEVCDRLNDLLMGQGRETVHPRSVRRWLTRWVEDSVLLRGKDVLGGTRGNKTTHTYTIPWVPPSVSKIGCPLSSVPSNPPYREGSTEDTETEDEWLSSVDSDPQEGCPPSPKSLRTRGTEDIGVSSVDPAPQQGSAGTVDRGQPNLYTEGVGDLYPPEQLTNGSDDEAFFLGFNSSDFNL